MRDRLRLGLRSSFAYTRNNNVKRNFAQHVVDRRKHCFICLCSSLTLSPLSVTAWVLFLYKPECV